MSLRGKGWKCITLGHTELEMSRKQEIIESRLHEGRNFYFCFFLMLLISFSHWAISPAPETAAGPKWALNKYLLKEWINYISESKEKKIWKYKSGNHWPKDVAEDKEN